jgi:tetratricopeptide (TPR) repeat protein
LIYEYFDMTTRFSSRKRKQPAETLASEPGTLDAESRFQREANEWVQRGDWHRQKDLPEQAVQSYLKAIALEPEVAEAHISLAHIYLERDEHQCAMEYYCRVIEITMDEPSSKSKMLYAAAFQGVGRCLFAKGDCEDGVAFMRRAVELGVDCEWLNGTTAQATMHFNLGYALANKPGLFRKESDKEEAVAQFRKGVELDPYNAEGLFTLGTVLYHQGQFHESVDSLRRALDLVNTFSSIYERDIRGVVHFGLAVALYEEGKRDQVFWTGWLKRLAGVYHGIRGRLLNSEI